MSGFPSYSRYDHLTVSEARAIINKRLRDKEIRKKYSEDCGMCGRRIQTYKRQISNTMARELIALYHLTRRNPNDCYHYYRHFKGHSFGDFSLMEQLGFVIRAPQEIPANERKKKTSGFWRITDRGIDFVLRKITVPQHMWTYNKKIVDFEGPEVDIVFCLGKEFDYAKLMAGEWD